MTTRERALEAAIEPLIQVLYATLPPHLASDPAFTRNIREVNAARAARAALALPADPPAAPAPASNAPRYEIKCEDATRYLPHDPTGVEYLHRVYNRVSGLSGSLAIVFSGTRAECEQWVERAIARATGKGA